jgi:hypothetical protein
MTESKPQESDQLPEEGPGGQVPDDDSDDQGRAPGRSSEAERGGQGESRGAESGDETAQTGNRDNAG